MLFQPLKIREIEFRNRIFVSPMCQYSAQDGVPNDWHLVHLGARATGGAGLVIAEATAVCPEGRISPGDLGIWSDHHRDAFKRITSFIKSQGSVAGIQIAHAGRKASTDLPWKGGAPLSPSQGGWETEGPSAIAFSEKHAAPREISLTRLDEIEKLFVGAVERSLEAGFEVVELHMAHGYLLHEFLSPLSNQRSDEYGGSLENRMRFPLRIARAARKVWPARLPMFVRISASDWTDDGWTIDDSVAFARELKACGIDLIDCSSGGNVAHVRIPLKPGYQVSFAEAVRKQSGIKTGAVGLITEAKQADEILKQGQADAILIARAFLQNPHWPLFAAHELGVDFKWPVQYERGKPPAGR